MAGILFSIGCKIAFGDIEYNFGGNDINGEIEWVRKRSQTGDHYPQGVDNVIRIMEYCRDNMKILHMVAKKTWPKWTWYVSVK